MAKKVKKILKLQITAGKAVPTPPLGPALGQAGVNIGEFINQFNKETAAMGGKVSVLLTVYEDRTFEYILKTPPISSMLKEAAKIQIGSAKPGIKKAGKITKAQLRDIAEKKMPDLTAKDLDAAIRTVEGSARAMGIDIVN